VNIMCSLKFTVMFW